MTRILLAHQPIDGGVGRHVADLATGLAEQGYDVVSCGPAPPAGSAQRHVRLDMQRAISPRSDLRALARFVKIVGYLRPDAIHAHSSKAGAIARAARLAHPRIPVIYTPHGYAFAGHFKRELEQQVYRETERSLSLLSSRVLCVCEAEARLARTVSPTRRVRVVHNGIALAPAGPADDRLVALAQQGPVLCALTQLRPGKGIETLIDALPAVLAGAPRTQVAIGGEGPDLESLRARSHTRGVADSVHFLGQCDDPVAVLRGGQVFVHPSWAESFPYAILEAMSAGLPVVASDVGGVGEAVEHGQSGLLVAPRAATELAKALLELLRDEGRGAKMGIAGRERVQERFTRAHMTAGAARVYEEAIGQSNG